MQIQVNTDDHVHGREDVTRAVEQEVTRALRRFEKHITRVEVHLGDVNAGKHGAADKRCMMEARPANHQPVAVTHQADSLPLAIAGAAKKLQSRLDTVLGRLADAKGTASIRDYNPGADTE
jgi:ribosome-associated translation inhibitor RaiA